MYVMAGYLVGQNCGMENWDKFIQNQIFKPLGMVDSNFSIKEMKISSDFSEPYGIVQLYQPEVNHKEIIRLPFRDMQVMAPAGGINSNLVDMLKWVKLHIDEGVIGEKSLISKKTLTKMHTPYMGLRFNKDSVFPFLGYGMGWYVEIYNGHYVVFHSGIIDGFRAMVSFMPKEKIGIVVLSNLEQGGFPGNVTECVYERILGKKQRDKMPGIKGYRKIIKRRAIAHQEIFKNRVRDTSLRTKLKNYCGIYEHPAYGEIAIKNIRGTLKAHINKKLILNLKHFHYDMFLSSHHYHFEFLNLCFRFQINKNGKVDRLFVPLEYSQEPIEFIQKKNLSK